jgi:hypothetical protein
MKMEDNGSIAILTLREGVVSDTAFEQETAKNMAEGGFDFSGSRWFILCEGGIRVMAFTVKHY